MIHTYDISDRGSEVKIRVGIPNLGLFPAIDSNIKGFFF